jgi:hypothetical protein
MDGLHVVTVAVDNIVLIPSLLLSGCKTRLTGSVLAGPAEAARVFVLVLLETFSGSSVLVNGAIFTIDVSNVVGPLRRGP